MSSRILIVDTVPTNRIVLKVKLMAAQHDVVPCANVTEARKALAQQAIDLILLDYSQLTADLRDLCGDVRARGDADRIPIIAIGPFDSAGARLEALSAGVDEVLSKPMNDSLLLARIRNILRARDTDQELRLRDDTSRALGFGESGETFLRPGIVALVADPAPQALALARGLGAELTSRLRILVPDRLLDEARMTPVPDLFVLDARHEGGAADAGRLFRMVADLRSRSETRHAAQLVIVPETAHDLAAMVLDLGASEVAPAGASLTELAMRCQRLIHRKVRLDQQRDRVQSGLQAAVTDALTGLYNRRYAIPHVAAMAERAVKTGRSFSLMVLDIDRFKHINDTFGHAAGDEVIAGVAARLRDNLRNVDLIARIGGEEFLIAMPDISTEEARQAADRLRGVIAAVPFRLGPLHKAVQVTLSIGLVIGGAAASADVPILLEKADLALYASKTMGRNRVTLGAEGRRPSSAVGATVHQLRL